MTRPTTSRAAVLVRPGQIELRDVEVPALAPGEVLVRVLCCTLCGSDLHTFHGRRPSPLPGILGHEIVGIVEECAGDVRGLPDGTVLHPGERVIWSLTASCGRCDLCRCGVPQKCDEVFKYGHEPLSKAPTLSGGLAEFCVLRQGTSITRVPESVEDVVAAVSTCAGATAAAALAALPDDSRGPVLIQGAGMLGLLATAMARSAGHPVLVLEVSERRRAMALRFGADETATPMDENAVERARAAITGDARGFTAAFEMSGNPAALPAGLEQLAVGGTYVLVGPVTPQPPWPVNPESLVRHLLTVRGVHNYHPDHLDQAIRFLADQGPRLPLSEIAAVVDGLEDVEAAFRGEDGGTALRTAVRPGQASR